MINSNAPKETPKEQKPQSNKADKQLKTYWATKTKVTMYKVRAESKKEAEKLLNSGTPYAATDTQKGVSTIWFSPRLPEIIKVFKEE